MTEDGTRVHDVHAAAAGLPESADTMLADAYLVDKESQSARVFRVYRPLPLHYHNDCDENLYVVSGRATFHLDGAEHEAGPGTFLCFERRTVHGFPAIAEHPLVLLSIDVPRRRPDDVVFVDPGEGDAGSFMARNAT